MQNFMIVGTLLYGALYTAGIFTAALVLGNHPALCLALIAAGAAYISQAAGVMATAETPSLNAWYTNVGFMAVSVLAGGAGGIAILIGA